MTTTSTSKVSIREVFAMKEVEGDVGLELELEGKKPLPIICPTDKWLSVDEPSLRNGGKEYITRGAINTKDVKPQLEALFNHLKSYKIKDDCHRASTHVHINVQEKSPIEVWTIVCAMWLVEDLLSEFAGDDRKGNLFCLRVSDAELILNRARKDMSNVLLQPSTMFSSFAPNGSKYSALNLCNIGRLGTLENRMMRSTTNVDVLTSWINNLVSIRDQASTQFSTPVELLDYYWTNGGKKTIEKLMSLEMSSYCLLLNNWEEVIDESACLISGFVYESDWSQANDFINKYYKPTLENKPVKIPGVEWDNLVNRGQFQVIIDDIVG